MAKEFYTVKVIPHLENETGEHDYAPMYEVQIDNGGKEKSLAAWCIQLEWSPLEIFEMIDKYDGEHYQYISNFTDICQLVRLSRSDVLDFHNILQQLDIFGSVRFEVTVAHLLEQSI